MVSKIEKRKKLSNTLPLIVLAEDSVLEGCDTSPVPRDKNDRDNDDHITLNSRRLSMAAREGKEGGSNVGPKGYAWNTFPMFSTYRDLGMPLNHKFLGKHSIFHFLILCFGVIYQTCITRTGHMCCQKGMDSDKLDAVSGIIERQDHDHRLVPHWL